MRLPTIGQKGWWLLVPCLIAFVTPAQAREEIPPPSAPQIWLNAGTYSRHFDRDQDFRENNTGFGAEAWLAENHALMAGTLINSDRARSRYAAYQWRPLHWQAAGIQMGAGIAVGAFDGYPRYHNGGWFAAALPALSVEYGRIGINFFIVPTIADRLDGALSVQLKLRVW